MRLENGIIKNKQLMYMVIAFMQGMTLTVGFCLYFTKQSTWIVILAAYAITLLTAMMYLAIAKSYPEKNLVQINDAVFGKFFGTLVSLIYIFFFFQLLIHYLYFFNSFWITYIMPETPRYAFLILFGLVSAYAVRKGLEAIARCCFLFALVIWCTTFILTSLLFGNMDVSNLLPVFDVPLKDFMQSTHIMLAIPFCDIVVFLMIFPYSTEKEKLKKPFFLGISISTLQLMIATLRDILTLGPRTISSVSASFTAARDIDLADILTRLDILVAISYLVTFFIKITIFYYVTVLGSAQTLKLRSYKPLIIPIGTLAVLIGAVLYPSDMEQVYAAEYIWPFNAFVCEYILPVITLAAIAIHNLFCKKKVMEET